jgi:molybdopterin-guanine dinucleotide biosynthesis protein A
MNTNSITIAIMAGGRSRRMGRDKAFVEIDGVPMLERVAVAALGTGLPVIVVGRERPEFWRYDEVRFVVDRVPDRGPLGGLATALEFAGMSVLALACDMPFMTVEALNWLIGVARDGYAEDGVVVISDGKMQPLFAAYGHSVLPIIEALLARDEYSMRELIGRGTFKRVNVPERLARCMMNVNVWDDIERIFVSNSALPAPSETPPPASPS